jgi:hypothetical protein
MEGIIPKTVTLVRMKKNKQILDNNDKSFEELHHLHSSPNIITIRVMNWKVMRSIGTYSTNWKR